MLTDWLDYELLDFGDGRKLERFRDAIVDRPCPAAVNFKQANPSAWKNACVFDGDRAANGKWIKTFDEFAITIPIVGSMQLAPLPSGQVGIFPEQFPNWQWISKQISRCEKPVRVLNLFAYTGGSTLAAAAAGAEVTHVDAAKSMVARARKNAEESELADHPIRWIVEDAIKFCQRELKRGKQYDAVILDPPSYGHGPKGESWSIKRDLLPLLELCGELTAASRRFVLCTCHTPEIGEAELSAYVSEGLIGHCGQPPRVSELALHTTDGHALPSGVCALWPG